ncbi:MAG TPA: hypothetical protein VLH86_00350 [Patescibacteria group bacterium]|nr:hypothetical protein [Patescibacteria group bacterium]
MASIGDIGREWGELFGGKDPDFDPTPAIELATQIVNTVNERATELTEGSSSVNRDMALGRLAAASQLLKDAHAAVREAAFFAGQYGGEIGT